MCRSSDIYNQAKKLETNFKFENVKKVNKLKNGFSIETSAGRYQANKIIIASGTFARKLGLDEQKFIGKGISY